MNLIDDLRNTLKELTYFIPYSPFRGIVWHVMIKNVTSVLDLGCSNGSMGRVLKLHDPDLIVVGVDVHVPYLKRIKRGGLYEECIAAEASHLPFKDRSFESVLCIEMIEHMRKDDVKELLAQIEKIARKQIVISTPVGNPPEGGSKDRNVFQFHKSEWTPDELRRLGYKVRGEFGPSFGHRFKAIYYVSFVFPTASLVWYAPKVASHMIAYKIFWT